MNVRYKKESNGAYMILEGTGEHEEYAARMLSENRIRGVMPLSVREVNGAKEYYFDISSGRSMSGVLEKRPVTMSEISSLLEALSRTVQQMDEYLMNINHLILEPGMICLPVQSRRSAGGYERMEADFSQALFCCHPAVEKDFLGQVRELIRFFLNKMDHMEARSVETAYELFQISQKEYFRLEEMMEVCGAQAKGGESIDLDEGSSSVDQRTETVSAETQTPIRRWSSEERNDQSRKEPGMQTKALSILGIVLMLAGAAMGLWSGWALFFGWEEVFPWIAYVPYGALILLMAGGGLIMKCAAANRPMVMQSMAGKTRTEEIAEVQDVKAEDAAESSESFPQGGTELLTGRFSHAASPVLVSENLLDQDSIYIRKIPFVLGKSVSEVDGLLPWPTVSRRHAQIDFKAGEYILRDCSSTNGTFLNGSPLEPERGYTLHSGDEVALADRRFVFQFA